MTQACPGAVRPSPLLRQVCHDFVRKVVQVSEAPQRLLCNHVYVRRWHLPDVVATAGHGPHGWQLNHLQQTQKRVRYFTRLHQILVHILQNAVVGQWLHTARNNHQVLQAFQPLPHYRQLFEFGVCTARVTAAVA